LRSVLVIANLFHASPRIPGLVKYLPMFGWQPIILTTPIGTAPSSRFGPPDWLKSAAEVVETDEYRPAADLSLRARTSVRPGARIPGQLKPVVARLVKVYQGIAWYPDAEKNWKPVAVREGARILENRRIEAIISSSSPVTCHLVASELKARHRVPWVADFRDLWSQNHNYSYGPIRLFLDKRLEMKTIRGADALVATSDPWARELKMLHTDKAVHTITNGFDPDEADVRADRLTSNFTITYTGNIYAGRQDPSRLLLATKQMIHDGTLDPRDLEVRFYGPWSAYLSRAVSDLRMESVVRLNETISRESSFARQRESQLLLLMNWEDAHEKGVYTLKIFEYLAAQRPILATGGWGGDVVEDLLRETGAGRYCRTCEDVKTALAEAYLEYKRQGAVSYRGQRPLIDKYSYREMARGFAEVLQAAASRTNAENPG